MLGLGPTSGGPTSGMAPETDGGYLPSRCAASSSLQVFDTCFPPAFVALVAQLEEATAQAEASASVSKLASASASALELASDLSTSHQSTAPKALAGSAGLVGLKSSRSSVDAEAVSGVVGVVRDSSKFDIR